MAETLDRDAAALRAALAQSGDDVDVRMSRETAQWLAGLIEARARGREVLLSRGNGEVSPAEAAVLLGMSRPQVRKLMDNRRLTFRKVGSHHRIRVDSIQGFLDAERVHMELGMEELSRLQNELGLLQ